MFKMDTRLKQTPLPAPCLTFLNKNFSDGNRTTYDNIKLTAKFDSLGLQNNPELESINEFSTEPRLHEIQQQRKVNTYSILFLINSFFFIASSIIFDF